ncbi:hypothetical protein [Neisseria animalis]|uniref:hypothetical protein n=1 Tax=Neisseria animalis TaxID=492 RepID=UPI000F83291A|nr:hypothetical protein [Neisseria animalis]
MSHSYFIRLYNFQKPEQAGGCKTRLQAIVMNFAKASTCFFPYGGYVVVGGDRFFKLFEKWKPSEKAAEVSMLFSDGFI